MYTKQEAFIAHRKNVFIILYIACVSFPIKALVFSTSSCPAILSKKEPGGIFFTSSNRTPFQEESVPQGYILSKPWLLRIRMWVSTMVLICWSWTYLGNQVKPVHWYQDRSPYMFGQDTTSPTHQLSPSSARCKPEASKIKWNLNIL